MQVHPRYCSGTNPQEEPADHVCYSQAAGIFHTGHLSTGLDTSTDVCFVGAEPHHCKRRRLEGLQQQTDSDRSSQLEMHLWREGQSSLPVHDRPQHQHSHPGSGLAQRLSAADTPSHSDCCSDNALSPHDAKDPIAAAKHGQYPNISGAVQSSWRLQQEHQSLPAAPLPAPQIMQPAP